MNDTDFIRYLRAKRSVDDRALNQTVWQALVTDLPDRPLDILEIGAGIGTMIERLYHRGILNGAQYVALDSNPVLMATAAERLSGLMPEFDVTLVTAGVQEYVERPEVRGRFDLIIAHAFLDLVDTPRLLPHLYKVLRPGGHFYFTINFDGLTAIEPVIGAGFDRHVLDRYHHTMDNRVIDGRRSGHSQSGRRLLREIPEAGGEILAAGASDWIILPVDGRYQQDEAYFLHYLLDTIAGALAEDSELDAEQFSDWIALRHQQIESAELIFIAHQIDIAGRIAQG